MLYVKSTRFISKAVSIYSKKMKGSVFMLKNYLPRKSAKKLFLMLMFFVFFAASAYAIDGVYHKPYGIDDLYTVEQTERFPRDPIAGENVYIKLTTWPVEPGQATWITWTKNGAAQPDIGGSWKYNSGNNSYWEVSMGSFSKGDVISYTVKANKDGTNEKSIGLFQFTVTNWESVSSISGYTDYSNHVVLNAVPNTGSLTPKINIAFTAEDVFRIQLSPTGTATMATGLSNYTLANFTSYLTMTTTKIQVKIDKNPFKMSVYKADGTTLIAKQYDSTINRNMAWLTNGSTIINKVQDHFYSPTSEEFYGFGERYNDFSKRGQDIETYVYNQYLNQGTRTYLSIPFFVNTKGYGIFLNSTYYSRFRLATERSDMYGFTADTGGSSSSMLDYYFIYGNDLNDVVVNYTDITSKPVAVPKWAFGLWMSANEWDRESEVDAAITNANNNNIPATAVVLEQWSDENTFYIFNEATYTAKPGGQFHAYSDFTFGAKWPNPQAMVTDIHNQGIKVLLWQVPVLKYTDYAYEQKDNDESYMVSQGYQVGNGSGGSYRTPVGTWFGNSLLLDFTNTNAKNWWNLKRAYLFDGVGIDGFKTDGGEMVWGREVSFNNGKKGDEMRNQYPNEYIKGYNDYAKSKKSDAVTFSRAGTTGSQKYQIYWAGDQESTFSAFQDAVRAGMTSNISGVPFWSWDLAGFTGSFPSAELYKRSIAMAAFSPIMQFHSEKANPSPSEERSPWNVASRTSDSSVITTSAKFVNTRMNLLPYIFSEAKKSSDTGKPMMRAMVMDYPSDTNTHHLDAQYMFGDHLLIAPIVVQGQTSKSIYLPAGEWIDFYWGAQRPGSRTISYYAGVDDIPVFVKPGAIIPMNLNANYELGGTIGNNLTSYNNLTFRVYPFGSTSYQWNDDIGGSVKTITSTEEYGLNKETVSLPPVTSKATLQVFTTKPSSVTVAGVTWTQRTSLSDLINNTTGWYYDSNKKFTYVKVASSTSTRSIVLNGVNKVEYEAEFATLSNVTTNTNHTGYTGTGFVDGFESLNDYVQFDVSAKSAGSRTVKVRYCSAGGNASRAIYLNGTKIQDLSLPATANWDTWATASVTLNLNAGNNTIKVQYDSTNTLGINLDNIAIVEN
jgi:alpha-glucosidase (family GH31 glycosyl hydrolase)